MAMLKTMRIGVKHVPIHVIEVQVQKNEQDWQFVFVNAGNGKRQMAVF